MEINIEEIMKPT